MSRAISKETNVTELDYVSTRGLAPTLNFEQVVLAGLASDGGLYLPARWPQLTQQQFEQMRGQPYEVVVFEVLYPFVGNAFTKLELQQLIAKAYAVFRHSARCPLVQLDSNLFLLELFHGPTLAFKDFAMQLVSRMFAHILGRNGQRVTIIGATSGDTGSAAIEAFSGLDSANVIILYPDGRVSDIQRRQMTTVASPNVHTLAVEGDFDACQARVKDMFNDIEFRHELNLGAVNSINWARIAVQVAYFVASALALRAPQQSVSFVVPTGNFGDIFAGYVAMKLGLPIKKLIIATNQNDILHRTLITGHSQTVPVLPSSSPSMDIQVSSNFERALFEANGNNAEQLRSWMQQMMTGSGVHIPKETLQILRLVYASGSANETETRQSIRKVWQQTGELICPHSAVGVKVATEFVGNIAEPLVALATAHPAKFPDAVYSATGIHPMLPTGMDHIFNIPERITKVPNDLKVIQQKIREWVKL